MHAKLAGVPVIGDIELFALARPSLPKHRVVGITGTNGKSTTTALVHHIIETAGIPTRMDGNIGLPTLAQTPLPSGGVYVLELSSRSDERRVGNGGGGTGRHRRSEDN